MLEHRGGTMPDASAITQLQVLEVAAVEAERRVVDADRCVPFLCPCQLSGIQLKVATAGGCN